ncbi:hypothetical protein WAK64_13225 [Bacillus spongiae]|uniref:Uncharacterized protein n=1 Tax=Bacillus spongiae TaxID=2683610 RepID=A0ABU8HF77_9BACI
MSEYQEEDIREAVDDMKEGDFHRFLFGEPRGNRLTEASSESSQSSEEPDNESPVTGRSQSSRSGDVTTGHSERSSSPENVEDRSSQPADKNEAQWENESENQGAGEGKSYKESNIYRSKSKSGRRKRRGRTEHRYWKEGSMWRYRREL